MATPVIPPRSPVRNPNYRTVGDESKEAGRGIGQSAWYRFAGTFCRGLSVLDVGCGLGEGVKILSETASDARGIDLDPRLASDKVEIRPIQEVPDNYIDAVTCIDVIEHVLEDTEFAYHLCRIARKMVLISTPNYAASRSKWIYHLREYMPQELEAIFSPYGKVTLFKGSPNGSEVYPVDDKDAFFRFCQNRIHPILGLPTRAINILKPNPKKMNSHLFMKLDKVK